MALTPSPSEPPSQPQSEPTSAPPSESAADSHPTGNGKKASSRSRVRATWPVYIAMFIVGGLVAGAIAFQFLTESLEALGIPDPGPLTTFGLPMLRAIGWLLMSLSVGSAMFGAFYISPRLAAGEPTAAMQPTAAGDGTAQNPGTGPSRRPRLLTVDAHLALRTAALSSVTLAVIGLLMIPWTLSDASGTPIGGIIMQPLAWSEAISKISAAQAWLATGGIAVVVAIIAATARTWWQAAVAAFIAMIQIIPLAMDGHSAAGGNHDYGTNSYVWHLFFLVMWIGGLMALLAHGRRLGPDMVSATKRYSTVALASFVGITFSGVVNAVIVMDFHNWFESQYGLIIIIKTVILLILGLMGFAHRQITIPELPTKPQSFQRLATVELILMAVQTGVAVTLTRTPPPPPRDPSLSPMEVQIGFELTNKPTTWNWLVNWRFDIMFGTLALLLAAGYLYGVWRARRQGNAWPVSRTVWWLIGCATLLTTTSSGIGMAMPAMYSMHMVGHMLLSMVVPLFLALGGPLSLLMAAYPPSSGATGGERAGAAERATAGDWVLDFTSSPLIRFLTNPVINVLQFVFFFYVMYLFPALYETMISEHAGHFIMNWFFLGSGYLYFWEVLGPDPIPHRRSSGIRLAILAASMPLHLFAGVYLMQLNTVLGESFYSTLNLPWQIDLLADQKVGGGIGWASGSFPLTFAFGMLAYWWWRDERSSERTYDKSVDDGDNDDLEAYNAMLAQMNSQP